MPKNSCRLRRRRFCLAAPAARRRSATRHGDARYSFQQGRRGICCGSTARPARCRCAASVRSAGPVRRRRTTATILEDEIARLRAENAALKRELLSRGLPLPPGAVAEPPAAGDERSDDPFAERCRGQPLGGVCRPGLASAGRSDRAGAKASSEQKLTARLPCTPILSAIQSARIDTICTAALTLETRVKASSRSPARQRVFSPAPRRATARCFFSSATPRPRWCPGKCRRRRAHGSRHRTAAHRARRRRMGTRYRRAGRHAGACQIHAQRHRAQHAGRRRQDAARHLAGHLCRRTSRTAAPARGDLAVYRGAGMRH